MSAATHTFQKIINQLRLLLSTGNTSIFTSFTSSIIILSNSFEFKIFNFIENFERIIRAIFVEKKFYKNSIDLIMTSKDQSC